MTKENALMGSTHAPGDQHPPPHPSDPSDGVVLLPPVPRGRRRQRPDTGPDGVPVALMRAGGPYSRGRFETPVGAFRLAHGLTAPGATPLHDAIALVVADWHRQAREQKVSPDTVEIAQKTALRFGAYATARGAARLADVTTAVCQGYCDARNARQPRGTYSTGNLPAALATRHGRLIVLAQLFATSRCLGLTDADPTVGVDIPPRPQSKFVRALTDTELARCRRCSRRRLTDTLLPAVVALASNTATSAEMSASRVGDLHLDHAKAWLHGGGVRTQARWADLDPWAVDALARRVDDIARGHDGPGSLTDQQLLYNPRTDNVSGGGRQCAVGNHIRRIFELAGLASTPGVRRSSFTEHAALRVYEETGRIEAVAAALGMRSLDKAAHLLGVDFRTTWKVPGPPGTADPDTPLTYAGVPSLDLHREQPR